jgi:hypothetical protein
MAQFIDVYQPTLPVQKAKTASDEFTLPILWALSVKNRVCDIAQRHDYYHRWVAHEWREVLSLLKPRNELLPYFLAADQARRCITRMDYTGCDRKIAVRLIGSMLLKVGAKGNDQRLKGIIELIEKDRRAVATGLWEPLRATIATVEMACDEVVANHTMGHILTPAEFVVAHRKARSKVKTAEHSLDELTGFIRKCDAVLLEFAPLQWCQPYLQPQYQTTMERMLELHSVYADDEDFSNLVARVRQYPPLPNRGSDLIELPKS